MRVFALAGMALATLAAGGSPAFAAKQRSDRVAIVLGGGSESAGKLQTAGVVAGSPQDSFEAFSFSDISEDEIEPATLGQYDTVVLNQVFTSSLSEAQKQTLSSFVTSGGKLIIHDADGTSGNEYSWLPVPATTGTSCENCGNTDGEAEVIENNAIVSNEPSSPSYINVNELPGNSDAVGDANMLVTNDPRWDEDIRARNDQNVEGAADAYASDGGLILYNGFDTDFLFEGPDAYPSGNDWLDKIWYDELNVEWDPDTLPHATPVIGASGHCGFRSIRVGVATVCAENIAGSNTETTATGNVVLDGGVSVGNGPIQIDRETKQIQVGSPVSISLLRSTGPVPLGTGAFSIEAAGSTDPVSGKSGLAKISLTAASLGPLGTLRVGSLPFSVPLAGSIAMYLDSGSGGGLIAAGSIQLPMLGKLQTSGALALGFYAGSRAPVVALGAAAHFGAVDFGKGWKFDGLDLSYQQTSDTWSASGGLEAPIGSLQSSGGLTAGQLSSLHVAIGGLDVPLGDSGFFFTGFGGGFSGLAKGPLKIDASTEGFWGAPKLPVEPFYLDDVTVTVNFSGSVSLDGAVSFALKDHSPVHGTLHLALGIHPFSATGTASMEGELPGVSLRAHGGAGFTAKHFTAAEGGSVELYGLSGSGEVIASDRGLGASGTLCAPFHVACKTMAIAGTWQQIGRLDVPALVGGQPQKLITVSGVATAGQSASVRVPRGRELLLVTIRSATGTPAVVLHSPGGRSFNSVKSTRTVLFTHQPRFGLTTIAVIDPRPGVWRIVSAPGEPAPLRIAAQTVQRLALIHAAAIAPASSAHHPLGPRAHLLLRWSSAHLPRGVRVTIVRHSLAHNVGVGLAGNLPANGHYLLSANRLAPGRNYITLAATLNGVPFQQTTFGGQAWRVAPRHRKRHPKGH
jgi:hypothetical protein